MSHPKIYNCSTSVTLGVLDRVSGLVNSAMKMSLGMILEASRTSSVTHSKTMVTGGWPTPIGKFITIRSTSARSSRKTGLNFRSTVNGRVSLMVAPTLQPLLRTTKRQKRPRLSSTPMRSGSTIHSTA